MSDLISRSELIKHFEAIQQQENDVGLDFVAMIDEIKEQPTAYDIGKVVEELSDDVCEWLCDEYGRWHTECHTLADNDPLEYTYCPYCGKKIKIVGD